MSERMTTVSDGAARRRRGLVILVIVLAVGLLSYRFVYPSVIKPLVDVRGKIASKQTERDALERKLDEADALQAKYLMYVQRSGGTNVNQIRDELSRKLNTLITDVHLREARVNMQEPKKDRKTSIATLTCSVGAEGTLQQVVDFLTRFYELPFLARINDLKLSPGATSGRNKGADAVAMQATVEAIVLPENRVVGPIPAAALRQAEKFVRHRGADYGLIAMRTPFQEYVEPIKPATPLPEAQGACCVGEACTFITLAQCTAQGGMYKGDGSRCESNPCAAIAHGPTTETHPIDLPQPPDPNRPFKLVAATLSYGVDEVRIQNTNTQQHEYFAVGHEMDGGELVMVHPLGAVVHKPDDDFVYPLGKSWADSMPLSAAHDYPEIKVALSRLREHQRAEADEHAGSESPEESSDDEAMPESAEPSDFVGPPWSPEPAPVETPAVPKRSRAAVPVPQRVGIPKRVSVAPNEFVGPPYTPEPPPPKPAPVAPEVVPEASETKEAAPEAASLEAPVEAQVELRASDPGQP